MPSRQLSDLLDLSAVSRLDLCWLRRSFTLRFWFLGSFPVVLYEQLFGSSRQLSVHSNFQVFQRRAVSSRSAKAATDARGRRHSISWRRTTSVSITRAVSIIISIITVMYTAVTYEWYAAIVFHQLRRAIPLSGVLCRIWNAGHREVNSHILR